MTTSYELVPIGWVESTLKRVDEAPNQRDGAPPAWIRFEPAVAEAVEDLRPGDGIVVLTWLHLSPRDELSTHPQDDLTHPLTGVFSTCSPNRPNPVGLHRALVLAREGLRIEVDALEAIDGTPVVDVKPALDQAVGPPREGSPRLDQVNLVVGDMEASVAFYRRLGLGIPDTVESFRAHHRSAELPGGIDLDFDSVEFARHWDEGWGAGAAVIGFRVESRERVDTIYADLTAAGYRGQQEPYDAFWGSRYAVVEDPDGNAVGLMSPVERSRRSDPGFPRPPAQ